MIDIAYILDGNTRTWYEAIDSDHIELDLDYLSFSLDVLYEGYDNQGQMVKVEKNFYKPVSSIYNSKNQRRTKPLYSYININELSDDIELNDFYEAPIRWRVQQGNSGEDIHVSLEFVKIYRHFIFPEIRKGKSIFSVPQVGSVKHWYINIKTNTTYFYPDWSENFSRKNNIGFESRMFHLRKYVRLSVMVEITNHLMLRKQV